MDKIRSEFDYIINHIRLVSHDGVKYNFYPQFAELSYEESVFHPTVHGTLFAIDAVDFPTMLPILGEERLEVSFTRQDEKSLEGDLLPPINFNLAVYCITGKIQDAGSKKRQTYTLKFTSDELYKNVNTRIFRKYKKQPYSSMVKSIFNEYLKIKKPLKVIEKTIGDYDYLIQNSSPIKEILYLSARSISSEQNGYMYAFYEDRDQFNFVSLSKLAKQKPIAKYTYEPKNTNQNTQGLSHKNPRIQSLSSVEEYKNASIVDTLDAAMSSEATSSLLTVDPIRRKYALRAFDLRGKKGEKIHGIPLVNNSDWNDFPHMGKGKPWKENGRIFSHPLSNLSMVITDFGQDQQEYISSRDIEITPFNPELFVLQRESHFLQLTKNIVYATLSGDPRIKAGCVIEFYIPELLGKTGEKSPEEFDKYLQGRYLVVGVAHILKKGSYRMNLELIKDSFFSNIKSRNPAKEYVGTY